VPCLEADVLPRPQPRQQPRQPQQQRLHDESAEEKTRKSVQSSRAQQQPQPQQASLPTSREACDGKRRPYPYGADRWAERKIARKLPLSRFSPEGFPDRRGAPYDAAAEERKKRKRLERRQELAKTSRLVKDGVPMAAVRSTAAPRREAEADKFQCEHCGFRASTGSGLAGHMKFCFSIRAREAANKALAQGVAVEEVAGISGDTAVGAAAAAVREAAERALEQAKEEGLTLITAKNASGYRGVYQMNYNWFGCQVTRHGQFCFLGKASTAEEAALIYARTPEAKEYVALKEAEEEEDQSLPQTAEACWAQAETEGLTLMPAKNAAGFHGVVIAAACRGSPRAGVTPFYSTGVEGKEPSKRHQDKGKLVYQGKYRLPEQAALVYARTPAGKAEALLRMPAARAIATAKKEGLELIRSSKNATGYLYVTAHTETGRCQVTLPPALGEDRMQKNLGTFDTAEAGALCVARHFARHGGFTGRAANGKRIGI